MSSVASSTDPKDLSGPSPSRPSWSTCSATTSAPMAPHPTAACSAAPAAVPLAKAVTAAPGTPPAAKLWGPRRLPPLWPAAPPPHDLRHAALSLWLNAGAAPAQIAQRAGHSIAMLLAVYTHCIDGQDDITNRQIERALHARNQAHRQTASGSANRRYRPHPVRHMSVDGPRSRARAGTREALHPRNQDSTPRSPATVSAAQSALGGQPQASRGVPWTTRIWPTYGPQWSADRKST